MAFAKATTNKKQYPEETQESDRSAPRQLTGKGRPAPFVNVPMPDHTLFNPFSLHSGKAVPANTLYDLLNLPGAGDDRRQASYWYCYDRQPLE